MYLLYCFFTLLHFSLLISTVLFSCLPFFTFLSFLYCLLLFPPFPSFPSLPFSSLALFSCLCLIAFHCFLISFPSLPFLLVISFSIFLSASLFFLITLTVLSGKDGTIVVRFLSVLARSSPDWVCGSVRVCRSVSVRTMALVILDASRTVLKFCHVQRASHTQMYTIVMVESGSVSVESCLGMKHKRV